jgi:hypothetical protein
VRLLADVRVSRNHTADIGQVDLRQTALVFEPLPMLAGSPGTATLAIDRPGRIVVDTIAPAPQLLSVGERYEDGWTATIDGGALRVLRINGDFIGCVVDAGPHRVELTFAPRSFSLGLLTSAAGLVALACGAFVIARGHGV